MTTRSFEIITPPFSDHNVEELSEVIRSYEKWNNFLTMPVELAKELEQKRDGLVFCRMDEKVVGATIFSTYHNQAWHSRRIAYFANMVVRPEYQRQRIGHDIASLTLECMKNDGAVGVETDLTTENAKKLYRSSGGVDAKGEYRLFIF